MKIIGHTGSAYLVEATEAELTAISGVNLRVEQRVGQYQTLPTGTPFAVNAAWARLKDLRDRAESLRRSAGTMRALADMLEQQIEVVEPPPPAAPAASRGDS